MNDKDELRTDCWQPFMAQYGVPADGLGQQFLLHGTKAWLADTVCRNGNKPSYTENAAFGRGAYFTMNGIP